jgi:hypothetical protein
MSNLKIALATSIGETIQIFETLVRLEIVRSQRTTKLYKKSKTFKPQIINTNLEVQFLL